MTRKSRVRKQIKLIKRRKTDDRTNSRKLDQDRTQPGVSYFPGGYVITDEVTEEQLAAIDPGEKLLWDIFTGADPEEA
jgi:hypothetical protein